MTANEREPVALAWVHSSPRGYVPSGQHETPHIEKTILSPAVHPKLCRMLQRQQAKPKRRLERLPRLNCNHTAGVATLEVSLSYNNSYTTPYPRYQNGHITAVEIDSHNHSSDRQGPINPLDGVPLARGQILMPLNPIEVGCE